VKLYDVTLRDGNHALRHTLDPKFVASYCKLADKSDSWAIEVGHGNGLGASSYLVGKSKFPDEQILIAARENLVRNLLAVHAIPGFATIKDDLKPAIEIGVDVFRIATHVTEATVAQKQIEFLANEGKVVHGVLMMSHMASLEELINQAGHMLNYGASAIILMDSAGFFTPSDVSIRVKTLSEELGSDLGFHAHNNMGVAISNAMSALENGAAILDGASMGLGAGAGNAQLELIVANLVRSGKNKNLEIKEFLELSSLVEVDQQEWLPRTTSNSIESGFNGVFSGYAPQVNQISGELGISRSQLWSELAKRKLVAGQETMIREIANDLMNL
jgi:4-hydroxy 2-oxovalerate aldolase